MPALHLVITTHTTRHLRAVLFGAARQRRRADRIAISCDNDLPEIAELSASCAREFDLPLLLVQRPHRGASRSSQVRNNGVRALLAHGADLAGSRLVFLDGDCCPAHDCFQIHEQLGARADLVVGFRIDLTPDQTEHFDEAALVRGKPPAAITTDQMATLVARHRRYQRHAFFRRLGLVKAHKPKLLSANFSITWAMFEAINGFDEEYIGYGGEDDDFGRRVYRAGGRPVIAVAEAVVYHLWHPTRAASDWAASPGIARFKTVTPNRAAFGLDKPYDQTEPNVTALGESSSAIVSRPAPQAAVAAS